MTEKTIKSDLGCCCTAAYFANVNNNGNCNYNNASNANSVRPDINPALKSLMCHSRKDRSSSPFMLVNDMINAPHDPDAYERADDWRNGYQHEIYDLNILCDAKDKAISGTDHKAPVQRFEINWLTEIRKLSKDIHDDNYKPQKGKEFIIQERGKTRPITGETIRDRVVEHALCDEFVTPELKPYLISANCASQKGKGTSYARKRIVEDLRSYYRFHGSNDGYILLMDFSKYYDNLRHDVLKRRFNAVITNDKALRMIHAIIDSLQIDVSYMTDEEYAHCMDTVFNSLDYRMKVSEDMKTGEKFMPKHMNLGKQLSQSAGISYPIPFDNYIKIVKGEKFYGRYTDDSYVIHESKEHLQQLLKELTEKANSLGITINLRKTKICRLSSLWRFLQIMYSLNETGRITQKINSKRLKDMRVRMKKLAKRLPCKEYHDWFFSWFKNYKKYMSRQQRYNMLSLLYQQKGVIELCTL